MGFGEAGGKEGSTDFVPVAERIATFDNDGTLWAEQPMYFQFFFALDRVLLWSKLRGTGLKGYRFRRQYSVKNYVLDFYCPKQKLAIEIDGDSHFTDGAEEYDRERQALIEAYDIRFLRFTNAEVSENIEGVVMRIMEHLPEPPPTPPW